MRERLHRLLLALMPWYDPEAAVRETAQALDRARTTDERRQMILETYREASRRYGRIGGR